MSEGGGTLSRTTSQGPLQRSLHQENRRISYSLRLYKTAKIGDLRRHYERGRAHGAPRHHLRLSPGKRCGKVQVVRLNFEGRFRDLVHGPTRQLYQFMGRAMQRIYIPLYREAQTAEDHGRIKRHCPRQERNIEGVCRTFQSGGVRVHGAQDSLKCFIFESKFKEELGL